MGVEGGEERWGMGCVYSHWPCQVGPADLLRAHVILTIYLSGTQDSQGSHVLRTEEKAK